MSKGDVVKAKNRADTKTEIPRGVLFADAGHILSKLQEGGRMSRRNPSKADYRALQRNSPVGVLEEALR